jgi:nucleoside phosphorylase
VVPVKATFALDIVRSLRALVVPEARELGDVRRNAAVFLARKAGDRRSSFERNLRPSLDATRFSEVPYLASVGFLLAAGILTRPPVEQLRTSLEKTIRRAPHTAERSGYADDAMCACGLLLLATAINDDAAANTLRENLGELTTADAALASLVTITSGSPVRFSGALDSNGVQQAAAAVLVHRIDEPLARKLFPGFPVDLEGHLLGLLAKHISPLAADFGSMVVLAAVEASVMVPDDELPAADGRCDVGILVALKEEFRILFERFERHHVHVEDGGRSYYVFEVTTVGAERPYRCVATLVGEMGTNRTGVVAEKMLGRWEPAVIVVIGIAGGIHKDVRLGDVVVASEVSNYIEGAKAVDGVAGVAFERAGDSFKTKHALLDRVRNFEFANRASFQKWETGCEARCRSLGAAVDSLRSSDLLRSKPAQREGHLASGPVVVTSGPFVAWIRSGDRACLCVEMEAGGAMITAHMDSSQRDVLVLRSISDFADDRKAALDQIGGGSLRRYAMENATDFLWSIMEAGVLPQGPDSVVRPASKGRQGTIEDALLRALREHADENGEITATWTEIREWLGGTSADLHASAIHLMEDGHFRSQTFEGGPDGMCNVVLRR